MFGRTLAGHYDRKRLLGLLVAMFTALSVPTAVVTWQAFDQLKWESWYRYRNDAQALVQRIDLALEQRVAVAETRSFDDYSFGRSDAGSIRLSPLSSYPPRQDVPGTVGYFQIDPAGRFSTPLLPGDDSEARGIGSAEFVQRQASAQETQRILASQALARDFAPKETASPAEEEIEELIVTSSRASSDDASSNNPPESISPSVAQRMTIPEDANRPESASEQDTFDRLNQADTSTTNLEQGAFDRLSQPATETFSSGRIEEEPVAAQSLASSTSRLGKVQELNLDDELEQKNEQLRRQLDEVDVQDIAPVPVQRERRMEPAPAQNIEADNRRDAPAVITTFNSEIDRYEYSLLGSGHGVMFRNAWRDGARFIQGMLVDQEVLSRTIVQEAFNSTTLASMSDLVVVYDDDVLDIFQGRQYTSRISTAANLEGSLLYRARLSPPFERIELIFSVQQLPPGPGGQLLVWTTIVIAIVFVAGFLALYRLGVGQIRLARQQQDFVSAVSHELKTPLTSIRMYGEMLKEGWADESKQRQYYEYIHDESERLTRLISNVLQLAQITRNEPQIERRQATMGELLDLVRSKIEHQVERAGFELDIQHDDQKAGCKLNIDSDCFTQIVINIVDNAIKFSRDADRKKIEIRAAAAPDSAIVFSIRDFGPGIPKDQLKKIFQMFYRTESELTRETVGTGIGLAIVHQLTLAMGGSVDVLNRKPGAEFRLTFPALDG